MSNANQNNDNTQDNLSNLPTSNIFGSSTKSSISSLFGSTSGQNLSESSNEPQSSVTSGVSTSRMPDMTDTAGDDAYDLFGTTEVTKTKVLGSKDGGKDGNLPVAADSGPTVSLFKPAEKLDPSSLFSAVDDKQSGLFGSAEPFGTAVQYDPSRTANIFADTHLAKQPEPPAQKQPPMLSQPEKPKEPPALDFSQVSEADFGDGYDSNLYAIDETDTTKLKAKAPSFGLSQEEKAPSLFSSEPLQKGTDLFGPPQKTVMSLESFGLGTSKPPTFNLVDTEQTNKVTESGSTSKTESLVEPAGTKGLFGAEAPKSNLFDELSKKPLFQPQEPKQPPSLTQTLLASTDLTTTDKQTDLFGVATKAKSTVEKPGDSFTRTEGEAASTFAATGSKDAQPSLQTEGMFSKPASSLFGSGATSGGLFGASDKPTTSMFAAADPTATMFQTVEKPKTSMFAPAEKPTASSLFAAKDTTGLGALMAKSETKPATTGGLFGAADKPATTGGLFGAADKPATTGGLFGAAETKPSTAGGLFGAADTKPAAAGGMFGTTAEMPKAAPLFPPADKPAAAAPMFGAPETPAPAKEPTAPLFPPADKPATPAPLFGGKEAAPPATPLFPSAESTTMTATMPAAMPATGLFPSAEEKTTPTPATGLFPTAEPAKTTVLGVEPTKPAEPFAPAPDALKPPEAPKVTFNLPTEPIPEPAAGAAAPGAAPGTAPVTLQAPGFAAFQEPSKLDVEFTATEQHTIAELLDTWEKRVSEKVKSFNAFADKVSTIDRQIVQQVSNMNALRQMNFELIEKHRRMEATIKSMEEEQKMAISVLDNMERVLKGKLESLNNRSNGYNMVQAISRNLQELSEQLSTTTKVAEDTAEACQPEPLYTIAKVLSFHQVSLIDLEKQCDEIESRIKSFELL